ncbi:MAG: hypothetical protein WCA46_25610 [Actinocatenispora sp.]
MRYLEWISAALTLIILALAAKIITPMLDTAWLDPRRQKTRRAEMAIRAASAGLGPAAETTVGVRRMTPPGKRPTMAFSGRYQGRYVAVAEYRHAPPPKRLRVRKKYTRVRHSSVVAVQLTRPHPPVQVIRRDIDPELWAPMARREPTYKDVLELDQRVFNRAFRVTTPHPDRARRLIHPALARAMLEHDSVRAWLITETDLLGIRHERLDPHNLLPRIGAVRMVADLIDHA